MSSDDNIWIALVILWAFLVGLYLLQGAYYRKMVRIGVELVLEARTVAAEYPDDYPNYRARAETALRDHATGPLVRLLPTVAGG